ncbi:MAG: hypothetical protein OHK0046_12520 [Anaerolineae bacterium]
MAVALIIALDVTPWVRGGYGWRWPYIPVAFVRVLPLLMITAVYLLGAFLLLQRTARTWPVVLWGVFGAFVMALAVAHAREGDAFYALFTRTADGSVTGPHWAAAQIDWRGGEWRDWTAVMSRLGGHLGTSPPGAVLVHGLFNSLFSSLFGEVPTISTGLHTSLIAYQCHNPMLLTYTPAQWASAWAGMLMPLWAGLTALPLVAVARRLGAPEPRQVAVWWPLVPGILAFAPSWSTLYPLFAVIVFWLLLIGVDTRKAAWITAAGLACGLALFVNFAVLPLLALCGIYVLLRQRHLPRSVITGVWFGLGLIVPWLLFWLASGETPWAILQASLNYHLDLERPYWFWVGMHVWDWALFTGIGLALLWLSGARRHTLNLALLVTVLALTLSGTTRGESGRIWLFLSPFVVLGAALIPLKPRQFALITLSHAALMLALAANLAVIQSIFTPPPPPPALAAAEITPVDAQFSHSETGAQFRLIGWRAEPINNAVNLTLRWEALTQMTAPTWFSAFLVDPGGATTEPVTWQDYPNTCWPLHTPLEQTIRLPATEGEWWVSLAAFGDTNAPEGRLQVLTNGQNADIQVGLGPVFLP